MRGRTFLAGLAVAAVTLAAWRPCLGFFFFGDDFVLISEAARESFGESLRNHSLGFLERTTDQAYFRPAWHLLFDVANGLFGLEPRGYFAASVALELAVALSLFALAARATGEPWLAALAAIAFALAPVPVEAIAWPSASFNVPPCALLLLGSGWALLRWLEEGRRETLAASLGLFALSFTFKEAGYQMIPLYLGTAWWCARREGERTFELVAVGGVLVAVVLLHFRFLNVMDAGDSASNMVERGLANAAESLRALSGIDAPAWALVGGALALLAAMLAAAHTSPRTRFVLVWAAAATFPYVFKTASSRFAYFFHVPLFLGLALLAADLVRARGRPTRVVRAAVLLVLAAIAAWNGARFPAALARQGAYGEECRRARDFMRTADFSAASSIAVDEVVLSMSGFKEMARDWCGITKPIHDLKLARRPPFALHVVVELDSIPPDVALLHWDEEARALRRVTRSELLQELILLPVLSWRRDFEVVEGPRAALAAMQSGAVDPARRILLYEAPDPPLAPGAPDSSASGRVEGLALGFEANELEATVVSDAEGFVALHLFRDLARTRSEVLVDGSPVPILRADGGFNAVRVPAGRHALHVTIRGSR